MIRLRAMLVAAGVGMAASPALANPTAYDLAPLLQQRDEAIRAHEVCRADDHKGRRLP